MVPQLRECLDRQTSQHVPRQRHKNFQLTQLDIRLHYWILGLVGDSEVYLETADNKKEEV